MTPTPFFFLGCTRPGEGAGVGAGVAAGVGVGAGVAAGVGLGGGTMVSGGVVAIDFLARRLRSEYSSHQ